MSNWNEYQKTMTNPFPRHNQARDGDVGGLRDIPAHAINQKDDKGYSLLMLAAYNGHADLSEYLIGKGADVNSVDLSGNSILMGVAFKGHYEIARLLLAHNADPLYANSKGQSALDYAQMFGRSQIVKLIKAHQNQPEEFGLLDAIKSWTSFFRRQGEKS